MSHPRRVSLHRERVLFLSGLRPLGLLEPHEAPLALGACAGADVMGGNWWATYTGFVPRLSNRFCLGASAGRTQIAYQLLRNVPCRSLMVIWCTAKSSVKLEGRWSSIGVDLREALDLQLPTRVLESYSFTRSRSSCCHPHFHSHLTGHVTPLFSGCSPPLPPSSCSSIELID